MSMSEAFPVSIILSLSLKLCYAKAPSTQASSDPGLKFSSGGQESWPNTRFAVATFQ